MSLCVCLADAGVTPGGLVLRLALPLALAAARRPARRTLSTGLLTHEPKLPISAECTHLP